MQTFAHDSYCPVKLNLTVCVIWCSRMLAVSLVSDFLSFCFWFFTCCLSPFLLGGVLQMWVWFGVAVQMVHNICVHRNGWSCHNWSAEQAVGRTAKADRCDLQNYVWKGTLHWQRTCRLPLQQRTNFICKLFWHNCFQASSVCIIPTLWQS